jgi:hypothetical protein
VPSAGRHQSSPCRTCSSLNGPQAAAARHPPGCAAAAAPPVPDSTTDATTITAVATAATGGMSSLQRTGNAAATDPPAAAPAVGAAAAAAAAAAVDATAAGDAVKAPGIALARMGTRQPRRGQMAAGGGTARGVAALWGGAQLQMGGTVQQRGQLAVCMRRPAPCRAQGVASSAALCAGRCLAIVAPPSASAPSADSAAGTSGVSCSHPCSSAGSPLQLPVPQHSSQQSRLPATTACWVQRPLPPPQRLPTALVVLRSILHGALRCKSVSLLRRWPQCRLLRWRQQHQHRAQHQQLQQQLLQQRRRLHLSPLHRCPQRLQWRRQPLRRRSRCPCCWT